MKQTNFIAFAFVFLLALSFSSASSIPSVVYNSPANGSVFVAVSPVFNATIDVAVTANGIRLNGNDFPVGENNEMIVSDVDSSNFVPGLNNWSAFFTTADGDVYGTTQYFYYYSDIESLNSDSVFFITYITPLNGSSFSVSPVFNAITNLSVTANGIRLNGNDFPVGENNEMIVSDVDSSNFVPGLNNWSAFFTTADGDVYGTTQYFYYDTVAPEIFLIGGNVTLTVGDVYSDAGATANDSVAGDLTSRINVTNDVNTAIAGTYTVQYNVTDDAGHSAFVNRTVIVNAAEVSNGGRGGGGGSCGTQWACTEWSACNAGSQTRTCSYPSNYCAPRSDKPLELRTCTVPAPSTTNTTELNNQTKAPNFVNTITGNVIGTTAGRWSLGIVVFLIIVGLAYWIVAKKRKAAQNAKSVKKK